MQAGGIAPMSHSEISRTFDLWAENGRAESMELGHGDVVRQVIARLHVDAGDKILDLGCGNGWATRMLARTAPGVAAVGIDVAPAMVARAEQQTSYTIRARYEVAAIEALPFADGSFQRIFSMEAIYYSPDLDRALRECARVLSPGGTIDLVLDCFAESPSTRGWSALVGLPMHCLREGEWRSRLERAGFVDVATTRVTDSRGPGDRASFTPSAHAPDWETRVGLHAAGSLWIHGVRGQV